MSTGKFIEPCQVFVNVDVATKTEALEFLAERGMELGIGTSKEDILDALLDREQLGPSGIEDGLAIPHAKSTAIMRPAVCLAKFAHPIKWESLDGKPVTIAVALYVPAAEASTTHVRYLSKVAVMASKPDFFSFVASHNNPDEIANYLCNALHEERA